MFAEIADLTLRLDSARTSVCYGPFKGVVYLSARAADARGNVAARMRKVVKGIGAGGGHRSMAGGQIPIPGDVEKRLALVRERLLKQFGGDGEPEPLIPSEDE
jgi:nanoRNase/pAp phosphatase (c-di-AMP/oligoRNAs hydrolase)